ncbi:MAG: hypothetical protein WEB07_03535, partial [Natronospirillum sp.]
ANLQARMRQQLNIAQSGAIRLALQLPASQQLPASVARQVLEDVAETWATRAIEERGVLRLNLPIYSARIFDDQRFEDLDYLIGIELLLENIRLVQRNVATLKAQPNAARVTDSRTGLNFEDLDKAIRDVAQYDLRQLIDPIKELGLTRNADVVRLFYRRQLQEMGLSKRFLEDRAHITREVLVNYSGETDPQSDGSEEPRSEGQQRGTTSPQLGDPFLDRLVDISRQGGEQEFRQELTRQMLKYQNEALDVDQQMESIRLTLSAINNGNQSREGALRESYMDEVQRTLPLVLSDLREYTDTIGRLHDQLGRQASGSVDEIISAQVNSFQTVTDRPVERRHLLIFIALMILTGLISLTVSLLVDFILQRRTRTTPAE